MDKRRLELFEDILKLTERMRLVVKSQEYDDLAGLLKERQERIGLIQNIDVNTSVQVSSKSDAGGEASKILKRINTIDQEIRLRIACEMDTVSKDMEKVRKGKNAMKGYNQNLASFA